MAKYQPYLIANARTGLELDMEPWLLPGDAFANLDNFSLFQGRIMKRLGYASFATLANNPVMGLFNYFTNVGSVNLMAMDTKRLYSYSSLLHRFVDVTPGGSGSDIFTGGDTNFFWCSNWLNKMYIVNGIDQMRVWDGVNVTGMTIDPNGTGHNDVVGMVYVTPYKSRLVILAPIEGSVKYAQRARWSEIGVPTSWPTENYLDIPTQDTIMGATFLRDELMVFCDYSIWIFRYTGDPELPFIWVRVTDNEGAINGTSIISFQDEAIAVGSVRIIGTDGTQVYNIDDKIPRLMLTMNQEHLAYCYSIVNEVDDQIWLSYPSMLTTGYPDKILVMDFSDGSWSTFALPMMCFGYFQRVASMTWQDLTIPWSQLTFRWADRTVQAGYPQLIGGDSEGNVFTLNTGAYDNGEVITADLMTAQLNPYVKSGRQCTLGWVDLLVDRLPASATARFRFYSDESGSPYLDIPAVPLDDGRGKQKAWVRIPSGCTADFHQIRITHNTPGQMVIHAIVPYFKPGARIYG